MIKREEITKEQLQQLYEKERLTTFEIAKKIGYCQATIWKKLKKHHIKSRPPGIKRVEITKSELEKLYIEKRLSTWQIEKKTGIPRGTIHRKMKEFDIKLRSLSEANIIYLKKDFSGELIEKSYLIGFRLGDLGVRKQYPNSKTIIVASGSTIKEQIKLIKNLFKKYGNVWIKNKENKINMQVSLNESFNFLLNREFPYWTQKNKSLFFSFLGGFTDAEGSVSISNKMAYYSLGNYNGELLFEISKNLNRFGIKCNNPTSDNRKGKTNSQGYKYRSNYWSLRVHNKQSLLKLLTELKPYIKHKLKMKALNNALENIKQRNKVK